VRGQSQVMPQVMRRVQHGHKRGMVPHEHQAILGPIIRQQEFVRSSVIQTTHGIQVRINVKWVHKP